MAEDDGWVSASDLAEYAYCPRAFWYREHPPSTASAPGADRSSARGQRFHRRALAAEQRRDAHTLAYVLALVLGAALILGVLALGFAP